MSKKSNNKIFNFAIIAGISGIVFVFISFIGVLMMDSSATSEGFKKQPEDIAIFAESNNYSITNGSDEVQSIFKDPKFFINNQNDTTDNDDSLKEIDELRKDVLDIRNSNVLNEDLVLYDGPIKHIFFHPLIAFPELAFDGDYIAQGFDDWFITVKEFNKILDSLYKNDYILIDINYIYEEKIEFGDLNKPSDLSKSDKSDVISSGSKKLITKRDLLLPPGKKPIIISIDDNNYYKYMKQNGVVHKLILDFKGNVSDYSITPDGKELISKENDIIPILNEFVKNHPDFSFRGAKGIIALTGYEGILGYRTDNPPAPNIEEEKQEAGKIIKRLKETGWTFACHGYGHLDAIKSSYETLKKDTQRWKDEVESLVGPTSVYIFPFGSGVLPGSEKSNYLRDAGFPIMCAVGNGDYIDYATDVIYMDRIHIDGVAFKDRMPILKEMFEIDEVVDEVRPWIE